MKYIIIIISILLGASAQVALKMGANRGEIADNSILGFINIHVILGLAMYGLSAAFWIYALSKVQLSFAYPMVSLGYVIVFVTSYFLFGEQLSALRISGLITIVAGVIMIAKS